MSDKLGINWLENLIQWRRIMHGQKNSIAILSKELPVSGRGFKLRLSKGKSGEP